MEAERLLKAVALWKEAEAIFASGPLDYYLTNLIACYDLLLNRYAPFKVGDRVALTRTPNLDDESWIDRQLIKQPAMQKHSYHFGEKSLFRVPPELDTGTAAKIEVQDK